MQLKIQRSQRAGGVLGGTIFFCLDVRADYSPEEADNIRKYKLGSQGIYNSQTARKHLDQAGAHLDRAQSGGVGERTAGLARGVFSLAIAKMSLNISIASLGRGHHIECKDLEELLEAEDAMRTACKNVTRYLEIASTFDGGEVVIEYEKGEERVHVTQHAPPLLAYEGGTEPHPAAQAEPDAFEKVGRAMGGSAGDLKASWFAFEEKLMAAFAAKGWNASRIQVRGLCCAVALVVFIILVEIL